MRFWSRLLLVAWLLTGLIASPAMSFGMPCHGGIDRAMVEMQPTMHASMAMPDHATPMHHQGKPVADKSAFACLVHCLGISGFVPFEAEFRSPSPVRSEMTNFHAAPLEGHLLGPPLEPPIPLFA